MNFFGWVLRLYKGVLKSLASYHVSKHLQLIHDVWYFLENWTIYTLKCCHVALKSYETISPRVPDHSHYPFTNCFYWSKLKFNTYTLSSWDIYKEIGKMSRIVCFMRKANNFLWISTAFPGWQTKMKKKVKSNYCLPIEWYKEIE